MQRHGSTLPRFILGVSLTGALLAASTGSARAQAVEVPWGQGDALYANPKVLPASNGALIRYQWYWSFADRDVYRIVYRTTQTQTKAGVTTVLPIAASAAVSLPRKRPSRGGLPTIAYTHGLSGVNASCAPSRTTLPWQSWVVDKNDKAKTVAPDYAGLGVDTPALRSPAKDFTTALGTRPFDQTSHPGASLQGEGRATLDAVRAANQLEALLARRDKGSPEAGTNPSFIAMGLSEGGHAALATGEIHALGYAPELELEAVVAGAPAGELQNLANPIPGDMVSQAQANLFIGMFTVAQSIEFRDIDPKRVFTPAGLEAYQLSAETSCVVGLNFYLAPLAIQNALTAKPSELIASVPGLRSALETNSPGHRPITAPVFVGNVLNDALGSPKVPAKIVSRMREHGTEVMHCVYDGPTDKRFENHGQVLEAMRGSDPARPVIRCDDGSGTDVPDPSRITLRSWLAAHGADYIP
jgi:Secretory lipase